MYPLQTSKPLRQFARKLFLVSRAYVERNRASEDVGNYLQRMRKSIIRMKLSYSDLDRLKEKIEKLIDLERSYAKFFKPEDGKTIELKRQINALEQELRSEKEEKYKLISENNEKIRQLNDSLSSIKNQTRQLIMEKARRQQRLTALDRKIREKVDLGRYYSS